MPEKIIIHLGKDATIQKPTLVLQKQEEQSLEQISPKSNDDFGFVFEVTPPQDHPTIFSFVEEGETISEQALYRAIAPGHLTEVNEFWCRSWNPFVYINQPQTIETQTATDFVAQQTFIKSTFISDTGGKFALGTTFTDDGGVLFGLYHPHAARVYVTGDFNDWQHPEAQNQKPEQFLEMHLYQGYFNTPNIWLLKVDGAQANHRYKFFIQHDSLTGEQKLDNHLMVDPYSRFLGEDYERNDSLVINPAHYTWQDTQYETPAIHELIIYELHVHGFTHNHPDIQPSHQGKYAGIIDLIQAGYFDNLGITCLYLMPISEVPTPQGEDALGYNTSLFLAIERDFGTPDDLRRLVDIAHQHNLAVIIDQVFNHSANTWNPLWKYILDHPDDAQKDSEGGLYFSGQSPWGNRMSTERTETQNMLIDACKLMLTEYHLDGFRFDATHTNYIDHGFIHRLADELQAQKPNVILIAENLPNQNDLNREGYNGFGQWCDYFHDTMKAFLREERFEGTDDNPENLGDVFYFSKGKFAAHTNNVVNYCESHDEHSVAHEVGYVAELNTPQAKERKARLGLFATMVALGQPMMYMGQEFGTDRARNRVYFDFPARSHEHGFYQWASRLIRLRRRYPGLQLHGFNPLVDGQFHWLIGPWLDAPSGGGKRVIGWRATPTQEAMENLVILMNFENHPVKVDIQLGTPGVWVRLASIDEVNDIAPEGTNTADDTLALHTQDGIFGNFVLPDSSAFIYKWIKPF